MIAGTNTGTISGRNSDVVDSPGEPRAQRRRLDGENRGGRDDQEYHGQHGRRGDDEPVAPELREFLADDGPDAGGARAHRLAPLGVTDQLEVDVLQRVPRRSDRQHVRPGRDQRPGHRGRRLRRIGHGQHVAGRAAARRAGRLPPLHGREPAEDPAGLGQRGGDRHLQRRGEQLLPQVVGPADGPQAGAHDRHPVAQPLRLLQPVGGEEDRDPAVTQPGDQTVHLVRRHRVKPRRRLVEEHDRRVVQQGPGQRRPLPQPLGQAPGQVVRPVGEADRRQRLRHPLLPPGQAVQAREVVQVLGHGQPLIQPRGLRHDRNPLPDLRRTVRPHRDARHRGRPRTSARSACPGSAPSWSCLPRSDQGTRTPHRPRR